MSDEGGYPNPSSLRNPEYTAWGLYQHPQLWNRLEHATAQQPRGLKSTKVLTKTADSRLLVPSGGESCILSKIFRWF